MRVQLANNPLSGGPQRLQSLLIIWDLIDALSDRHIIFTVCSERTFGTKATSLMIAVNLM